MNYIVKITNDGFGTELYEVEDIKNGEVYFTDERGFHCRGNLDSPNLTLYTEAIPPLPSNKVEENKEGLLKKALSAELNGYTEIREGLDSPNYIEQNQETPYTLQEACFLIRNAIILGHSHYTFCARNLTKDVRMDLIGDLGCRVRKYRNSFDSAFYVVSWSDFEDFGVPANWEPIVEYIVRGDWEYTEPIKEGMKGVDYRL